VDIQGIEDVGQLGKGLMLLPGPAISAVPSGCPWPEGGRHFAGGRW